MRLTRILPIILLLTACTPAAPVATATAVSPTETSVPTSEPTLTLPPTSTPEPTATPEPTKVPMPEGWTAIAETQEIGGRQVVLNEKGDAATQIDGEWYPVDAKGCFYKEFFDPEIQKQDPEVMELVEKLSVEPSFIFPDLSNTEGGFWPRHMGGSVPGTLVEGDLMTTQYWDKEVEGILSGQQLCYNQQIGRWEHVVTFVLVRAEKAAPKDTLVSRGVVGWLDNDTYTTFTYLDEAMTFEKTAPLITGPGIKANSLREGFDQWDGLIEEKKQVGIRMPFFLENNTKLSYEEFVSHLVQVLPETAPRGYSENIQDPVFVEWLLKGNNMVDFFSVRSNEEDLHITHKKEAWKYWGEQTAAGKMPEPVIRTITQGEHK